MVKKANSPGTIPAVQLPADEAERIQVLRDYQEQLQTLFEQAVLDAAHKGIPWRELAEQADESVRALRNVWWKLEGEKEYRAEQERQARAEQKAKDEKKAERKAKKKKEAALARRRELRIVAKVGQ